MSEHISHSVNNDLLTPNDKTDVTVSKSDLPLHCPTPEMSKWNSHPKVFIPLEDHGESRCPYCGTLYRLAK